MFIENTYNKGLQEHFKNNTVSIWNIEKQKLINNIMH